ncbi:MFS transporter [Streptomyces sp. BI20]|uniref:MFS transporter n=1 Tax=Streptomyces sp. BI20 TaxID=3403460 RepID=UPI003C71F3DD
MPRESRTGRAGRRELLAAGAGGVVESFDWTVYAVLAPYFAARIFPAENADLALIGAYAGFAVGFAARPLGGWALGRIADRAGRRHALVVAVLIASAASLALALCPTHAAAGLLAPAVAVTARAAQGFSLGGETPSAAAYLVETAPPDRRYRYGALGYAGVVLGTLLSFGVLAALLAVLGRAGVEAGGWRLGFAAAALLGLAALWIRRGAPEAPGFEAPGFDGRVPVAARSGARGALRPAVPRMGVVLLLVLGVTVGYYLGALYLPRHAAAGGGADPGDPRTALVMLPALLALAATMVGAGWAADRWGPVPVLRIGLGALALVTVPVALGAADGRLPLGPAAALHLAVLGLSFGPITVYCARLFPPAIRGVAVGVPFAVATGAFGGTFPLLAEALRAAGAAGAVPWAAAGAALLSLAATALPGAVPDDGAGIIERVERPGTSGPVAGGTEVS